MADRRSSSGHAADPAPETSFVAMLMDATDWTHSTASANDTGDKTANSLDEQLRDNEKDDAVDDADDSDDDDDDDDGDDEQVDTVESDECCICCDVVTQLNQGRLSACDHKFHFDCIVAWAKVTNLCPLCKTPFRDVTRVDARGAVVHVEPIADATQVFRADPADHDIAAQLQLANDARCEVCGRGDDEHVLLLCDARACAAASHTYCIGLTDVPSSAWYCSRHASGTRASDFIERRATTVSSRRTTRRLAHLMSNVLSGRNSSASGRQRSRRGRGTADRGSSSSSSRNRRAAARVTLASDSGRPIRGIAAAAYALRMSQELQQIHRRAELMYARGEHHQLALGTPASTTAAPRPQPPHRHLSLSRSTIAAPPARDSTTDLMWQDFDASRDAIAAAQNATTESASPAAVSSNRSISRTLAPEFRALAKLMVDAVGSDTYASTVSLVIPKTAKLRLVSRVKTFFARLSSRERVAVLDMGCLDVLYKWIAPRDAATAESPHPQVLDAVLTVVEALPVRQKDLLEVPTFRAVLDEIAAQPSVSVELRERAIVTSERWRSLNPSPPPTAREQPLLRPETRQAATSDTATESLPAIRAFAAQKQPARRPKEKTRKPDAWTEPAVQYVKAKLYPLYKHGNGKLSKERFKAIVKQVLELFRPEASAMQSQIVSSTGELSNVAKTRLKTLIDRSYKASSTAGAISHGAAIGLSTSSSYSAMPSTKHRRTS